MDTNEPTEPIVYSDDPFVDASLKRLDNMAAEYRRIHAEQVAESETVDYLRWKSEVPAITDDERDSIPDTETLANFLWKDATPAQLFTMVAVIDEMRDSINRKLRSAYNSARGIKADASEPADLSAMRAKLITILDSTLVNIEAGMFDGMTEDMVYGLPNIGPKEVQAGGRIVWDFPKAPRSESTTPKTNGGKNLRRNNTTVRILINGADPTDYPESNELGDACGKYLKCTVQEAAKLFNDWTDKDNPRIFEREGVWYGLTSKPRAPKSGS